MRFVIKQICSILCIAVVLAGSAAGSLTAYALDNGIYLADATSYYAHPYTGVIEDSGGESSSVLGQSMTESALYPQALIEVDPNGNTYVTIRLNLMDNIENPQFMVQNDGYSNFYDVSADCMQENFDNNTSDFRFPIASENSIVRSTFYVVPMGRDVVFYIGFSNLTEGSGDFVTSVEVVAPVEEQPEVPVETEVPVQTTTAEITTTAATTVTTINTTTVITTTVASSTVTLPVQVTGNQAKGIVMFDEDGNEIEKLSEKETVSSSANEEESESNPVVAVCLIGGVILVIIVVSAVLYKRKRGSK